MTKFEEKLEILPIKTIQHPVGDTKYYAAVHVKTLIAQADEEIANLKSQLQQQALPVVPDFIGKLINTFGAPEDGKYINYSASYLEIQKELDWIDNHQKTWLTALLIGFRVEKPQLFYLRDELTGQFLAKDNQFKNEDRYFFWTGADPLTHSIGTAWKLT
ncbi:DUF1642 domain-containing protein, partial [Lactococcus lactis subsp. lactis]